MKLVMFEVDGRARAGRLEGEAIVELGGSIKEILASGALERARQATGARHARKAVKLLAPIPDPGMVLSVGMNYHEHLKEMKTPVPEKPAAFTKSVASIIATGQPIKAPKSHPGMLDWEGEFSVVIGKPCYAVKAAEALDYVAGYTLVNDVSARDWVAPIFKAQGIMGPILAWEHNLLGKMFPTFCPMGPCMVTKDELPDPDDVNIETRLNGKVMQSANTDDLVFSVAQLIEYYSQFYLFRPGDVITTGSPSGVGFGRDPKVFMKPGDVVEVEVKQIGVLRNPIEA
jgi:2-keto-4-pentenoate hydratase/2-oxohepta-3-ene-1,7-dioic acid hydratase in catechol pathway